MSDMPNLASREEWIRAVAIDPRIVELRMQLAAFTSETFLDVGTKLQVFGHLLGPDRKNGISPFGHGDDAAVAVALLLRIGSQLVSGSADLIADGRHYAGSALIRQLVEVEYLAWAFETKSNEAGRWLRSNQQERLSFFSPAKLRKAAAGHFRGVDYGYHCEMGGHPVPSSWRLLTDDASIAQIMLSDCLGHSGRIWDHVVRWAQGYMLADIVTSKAEEMRKRHSAWKEADLLTTLPAYPGEDRTSR